MKRFLLFAGHDYYPSGGFEDFVGDFETTEDARGRLVKFLEANGTDYKWSHIYDTLNMCMVYEL